MDVVAPEATFAYVHPDHPLSLAMERMGAALVDTLPVVSRADIRHCYGVISLPDILAAYGIAKDAD
jgi:CBS domain-containing protein